MRGKVFLGGRQRKGRSVLGFAGGWLSRGNCSFPSSLRILRKMLLALIKTRDDLGNRPHPEQSSSNLTGNMSPDGSCPLNRDSSSSLRNHDTPGHEEPHHHGEKELPTVAERTTQTDHSVFTQSQKRWIILIAAMERWFSTAQQLHLLPRHPLPCPRPERQHREDQLQRHRVPDRLGCLSLNNR